MSENESVYGVRLEDHMSGPADAASRSMKSLAEQMGATKKAIEGFSSAPGPLTDDRASDQEAKMHRLSSAADGLKESMHGALSKHEGGGHGEEIQKVIEPTEVLKDAFKEAGAGFSEMMSGLRSGEAKEVVGGLAETVAGLASSLDLLVPGLGQAAAAVIRFGGAVFGTLAGLVQESILFSIEATQAKDAMIDTFAALGGGHEKGVELSEMLEDLSRNIGISADKLEPFARKFAAMGITGKQALEDMTLAAISAQSVMRDPAAGEAFVNLSKKIQIAVETGQGLKIPAKGLANLAAMGANVNDVAARMSVSTQALAAGLKAGTVDAEKFGKALQDSLIATGAGPLDRVAKTIPNIIGQAKQAIEEMFEGLSQHVDPLMERLSTFVDLFDKGSVAGEFFGASIKEVMGSVLDSTDDALHAVRRGFLDVMIYGVEAATFMKAHWLTVKTEFGMLKTTIELIGKALSFVADMMGKVEKASHFGESLYRSLGGLNTVQGALSVGMHKEGDKVKDAGAALGSKAKEGLEDKLEIKSPSRVFMRAGSFVGAGLSAGMRSSGDDVERAASGMGSDAIRGIGSASTGSGSSSGGGAGNRSFGPITIHITAPEGVTGASELTETAIAVVFERLALHAGM